eukprot:gene33135-38433_t
MGVGIESKESKQQDDGEDLIQYDRFAQQDLTGEDDAINQGIEHDRFSE